MIIFILLTVGCKKQPAEKQALLINVIKLGTPNGGKMAAILMRDFFL
jgi:hypothetical protein